MLRLRAFGLCLAMAAVIGLAAPVAHAASGRTAVWTGIYQCAQGVTGARLSLSIAPDGAAQGLFEFHDIAQNPGVPRGCFEIAGRLDSAGHLTLQAGSWRLRPPGFVTVGLTGEEISGDRLVGQVSGPGCSTFALVPAGPVAIEAAPSACLGVVS